MMSFCKKSVHNFLGITNSNETLYQSHHRNNYNTTTHTASPGGLGLFTISNNTVKQANVVESCASIKSPSSTARTTITTTSKKDPGGIGFLDEVGGSVDGLMSCTESLGFESSDERRVADDLIDNVDHHDNKSCLFPKETQKFRSVSKRNHVKREVRKFPPPLSSLDHVGRPTIYLHPVRKDGRLELTGVRIVRKPEILHAYRENGRLRLDVIDDDNEKDIEEEENQHQQEEEKVEITQEKIEPEIKVEEKVDRWRYPMASVGGGDGFRRCNELVSHHDHHHRHLNVWRQHCLTMT